MTFLTRKEAADALSISTRTLDRQINENALPTMKIGRRTLVSATDLEHWVARLPLVSSAATNENIA